MVDPDIDPDRFAVHRFGGRGIQPAFVHRRASATRRWSSAAATSAGRSCRTWLSGPRPLTDRLALFNSALPYDKEPALLGHNEAVRALLLFGPSDHVTYPRPRSDGRGRVPRPCGDWGHFVPWGAPGPLVSGLVAFSADRLR